MDTNLRLHLESRDKAKELNRKIQKTIKGKRARSNNTYTKYNSAAADYLKSQKSGTCYENGISVKED